MSFSIIIAASLSRTAADGPSALHIHADVTLPADGATVSLGSLFEVRTASGQLVAHAGSSYGTSTMYSLPTTELSFFVNATDAPKPVWTDLGKPFPEAFTETRIVPLGGQLYAVNKHVPAHAKNVARYNEADGSWTRLTAAEADGLPAWQGAVEACGGVMGFERLGIRFNGKYIYDLPGEFTDMFSHYHNGKVLIYAMTSYASNAIIVGKYACGAKAIEVTHRFADPVPHDLQARNFPYAWQFLDGDEDGGSLLLNTNLGFVYLVRTGTTPALRVLQSHAVNASWQPYAFVSWFNETLLGQYPSGSVFAYVGAEHSPPIVPFMPAVDPEPGAGSFAREAQTLAIYAGELLLGVWPWGTVHSKGPTRGAPWKTMRRLFSTPPVSLEEAPWMAYLANTSATNQWGQRVNGMVTFNGSLYATTSAKNPITDDLYRGLIPSASEAEYARVHRLTAANEASGQLRLAPGRSRVALDFALTASGLTIKQDGVVIASSALDSPLHLAAGELHVRACEGIYGPCAKGVTVEAKLVEAPSSPTGPARPRDASRVGGGSVRDAKAADDADEETLLEVDVVVTTDKQVD